MTRVLRSTGPLPRSTFCLLNGTSQPIDLLLAVERGGTATLGRQIEDQFRSAIRDGRLHPGARVPSTRELARQLGISRRITVEAYAQLNAEGYLTLRQGARPCVSATVQGGQPATPRRRASAPVPRFDFRPSTPDVSAFPRQAWMRSLRWAVNAITDADLGYGDVRGVDALRDALADYLGRVRGVVADPGSIVITSGDTQALGLACGALAARGATAIAVEDPSDQEWRAVIARAGLTTAPVPVDEQGLCVSELPSVDGAVVAPAHQHPTGAVLSPDRRATLVAWLRDNDAVVIEDDYDDAYRYDRGPVGALQGLAPDSVIYAGSVSKTLAPALRMGWMVVPPNLLDGVVAEKKLADRGSPRVEQLAFADFLSRGELDRHLRRMRSRYRVRRELFVAALAKELPEATVRGIAAGLHVTLELPAGVDIDVVLEEARRRRVVFETNRDFGSQGGATLMLGYARISDPAIEPGVRELAATVRAAEG